MKIGVDARALGERHRTGVGYYIADLLTALIDQGGDDYHLFANAWQVQPQALPQWPGQRASWHVGRWPNKLLNSAWRFFGWPKMDQLLGGVDVLLVPNSHFINWSADCPTVLIKHDLSPVTQSDLLTPKLRLWHRAVAGRKLAERVDHIIAISHSTKRDLVEVWHIPPEKITVIYPGVTPIPPTTAPRPVKGRYILTLATKEPRKNQAAILMAFAAVAARLPDVSLVIAGSAGWGRRAQDQLMAAHPFRDRIIEKPYVTEVERAALYRHAAAFVFPSWSEGFGFPPLEAMSAGVPVVTSLTSATGEVCGDAALLVDPQRSVNLAEAIVTALTDEEIRQRLIERGAERWRQFTWEQTARETSAVLAQVAYAHRH